MIRRKEELNLLNKLAYLFRCKTYINKARKYGIGILLMDKVE